MSAPHLSRDEHIHVVTALATDAEQSEPVFFWSDAATAIVDGLHELGMLAFDDKERPASPLYRIPSPLAQAIADGIDWTPTCLPGQREAVIVQQVVASWQWHERAGGAA